ncbi:transmembrane protein [Tieghemostelium lacteum]|uniref:Transmembrane protein n=1 Tax=Tieghemostelium lacteum TaxID=361077 RepID=A0A151ZK18_TIELA|nr:transmembrane protein [Tieghemostelium lacteum]|eukprot:KYQ94342.1 transmembrane protein [Tieghemostelium lacteum]
MNNNNSNLNSVPKKSSLKQPRYSLLGNSNEGLTSSANNIYSTPIKESNFMNEQLNTPMNICTPYNVKNRVVLSEIKPTVHRYPSSPYTSKIDSTNEVNNNINQSTENEHNNSFMSTASSKYFRNKQTNKFTGTPESLYYQNPSNSANSSYYDEIDSQSIGSLRSSNSTAQPEKKPGGKKKKKPLGRKIKDLLYLPVDKFDQIHQDLIVFMGDPFYKTLVHMFCVVLNALLFLYATKLFDYQLGYILMTISLLNSIFYFTKKRTVYLYRFQGTKLNGNMKLLEIKSPTGSIDMAVQLNIWEPSYASQRVFTFFSPLSVFLNFISGSDYDNIFTYFVVSILVSLFIWFVQTQHEDKLRDEKIMFNYVCEEYNNSMKAKNIYTLDKSTQT